MYVYIHPVIVRSQLASALAREQEVKPAFRLMTDFWFGFKNTSGMLLFRCFARKKDLQVYGISVTGRR
jgi:hypothetical protein